MTMLRFDENKKVGQRGVSPQTRLPTDDGSTSNAQTITGEALTYYYYTAAGVLTADVGQPAGTVVVIPLINDGLQNGLGTQAGEYGDSSLSLSVATYLSRQVPFRGLYAEDVDGDGLTNPLAAMNRAIRVTQDFRNGDFCVDHVHGVIYGKKLAGTDPTGTTTATYIVRVPGGGGSVAENVNLAKVGGTATDTNSGTASAGTLRTILASGATATRTTVTPSLASQSLIAASTSRKGLRVVSTAVDPTQQIWISTAATATSTNFFTKLVGSGEVDLYSATDWPYNGAWTVISDVASGTLQVIQLT